MNGTNGRVAAIAVLTAAFCLGGSTAGQSEIAKLDAQPAVLAAQLASTTESLRVLETEVYNLVNTYRRSRDLPPLVLSDEVAAIARQHSQAIASGQIPFSHDGFEARARQLQGAVTYRSIAENIASNQGFDRPSERAVAGWVKSSGHQRNILGSFDRTGIGIARAGDGTYYFTQLFIQDR